MTKKERLEAIIAHYGDGKPSQFAKLIGVAPSTISSWLARDTFDYELLFAKCENINSAWLLTGEGDMLLSSPDNNQGSTKDEPRNDIDPTPAIQQVQHGGIPLIPTNAMAGFATGGDTAILEYECDRYVVPMFRDADFLIPVKGSSMIPKYNSGDLVACKHLPLSDLFFQWNHVYVLDTDQGALIKRVQRADDDDHILCVSDNTKYEPFKLHRSQIHAIAVVVGVIRLE